MDLNDILSISGKPGLYKNLAQSKTGVIVEGLHDGKRFQVFGSEKISAMGEISIYTSGEDMPLREVFRLMQEKQEEFPLPDPKQDDKAIIAYFTSIVPEFDKEKFYVSHMRKVIGWYSLLIANGINDFTEPEEETTASPGESDAPEAKE